MKARQFMGTVLVLLGLSICRAALAVSQCPVAASKADYEAAWDEVLRDKKIAVEEGIKQLEQIKAQLQADYRDEV